MPLMIPGAPQFSRYENNIETNPVSTPGTIVNHYVTTAHTKNPTYTQLIATTAFDATLVIVTLGANSVGNGDSSTLLDIAIGAASSETVIIPDLLAGFLNDGGQAGGFRGYLFPLYIPAGSRLSARTQSVRVTGGVDCLIELYGGPLSPDRWWYGHEVTAYGHNATNSAGTKFTPGNSGAEGTGVSLGTTSRDHEAIVIGVQGHPDDVSWSALSYHFDLGIDSSSTEWFEADRFFARSNSIETIGNAGTIWWPVFRHIPSGTEIMVRGECSGTADDLSAAVYGVS